MHGLQPELIARLRPRQTLWELYSAAEAATGTGTMLLRSTTDHQCFESAEGPSLLDMNRGQALLLLYMLKWTIRSTIGKGITYRTAA